jgi:hypothetical protein
MKTQLSIAFLIAFAGCASEPADPFLPGFEVTPPTATQKQLYTPIIPDILPGQDITYCSYLDYQVTDDFDVTGYKGFQSAGGHHNILYGVRNPQPVGTHECTEDDMINVHYLGGGGTDGTIQADALPEGIVFRVRANTQLMILSHWINTSDETISGQAAYNVNFTSAQESNTPADLFTNVNTMFQVPTGISTVHTACVLKQDMKMFLIGPHAHEHATHMTLTTVAATTGESTMVQDLDWNEELIFDTPLIHFTKEAPLVVKAGDTFAIDCTYNNTTGSTIPFPSEMCVSYGYYFPANEELDCVDGIWP